MGNSIRWIVVLFACRALLFGAPDLWAASYPDRPIRLIVGFAPGGSTDISARIVARKLQEKYGQPVIIDNRPGADSTIAADVVAHAPADGHTLLWASNAHTIAASLYKLNYDSAKSFAAISQMGYIPDFLVVSPTFPANTLNDFISLARSKPGALNFGSPGTGTSPYLEMALLMKLVNIKLVHVSYKGGAPAMTALLGDEVHVLFGSLSNTAPYVKSGRLKALAITGTVRSTAAPDVPTMAEAADLKGFETSSPWNGLMAPAGTPRTIINKLHSDMVEALKMPDAQKSLTDLGFVIVADTPEQFTRTVANDIARWAPVIKSIEVK